MSAAFAAAADAWSALLGDSALLELLHTHFDAVMVVVVALAQPEAEHALDWEAVRSKYNTEEEEQGFLSFVFVLQELTEVIVRENLSFLIDDATRANTSSAGDGGDAPSASQRELAAQQDALVQKLPQPFRLAFLKTLRKNWKKLQAGAAQQGVSLNRLTHMSWRVVRPYVLMRIITSDNKRRIIRVPMKQFHQLRYSTAKVLQEMTRVETHPIMRLTNLEQSKSSGAARASDAGVRAAP